MDHNRSMEVPIVAWLRIGALSDAEIIYRYYGKTVEVMSIAKCMNIGIIRPEKALLRFFGDLLQKEKEISLATSRLDHIKFSNT